MQKLVCVALFPLPAAGPALTIVAPDIAYGWHKKSSIQCKGQPRVRSSTASDHTAGSRHDLKVSF